MKRFITPLFLAAAGGIAIVIGAAILFVPRAFFATSQIILEPNPSLMSEIRAPGGLLLVAGLFILAGGFVRRLTEPALMIVAIGFGAYGSARLISIAVDGLPSGSLVFATILELACAVLAAILIVQRQNPATLRHDGASI